MRHPARSIGAGLLGIHPAIPALFVAALLVAVTLVPAAIERRVSELREQGERMADPAHAAIRELQLNFALETAGTRGYLLTGDRTYAVKHHEARTRRVTAINELIRLSDQYPQIRELDPLVHQLAAQLAPADAVLDSLYRGDLTRSAFVGRLGLQQRRLETAANTARSIGKLVSERSAARLDDVYRAQRVGRWLVTGLVLLAGLAAILVARLGTANRRLARLEGAARAEADRRRVQLEAGERAAREELREIEAIYATAPIGLCVIDTEFRVVRVNAALADLNGMSIAEHIGRTLEEVRPGIATASLPAIRQVFDTGLPVLGLEVSEDTPPHPPRHWLASFTPLHDHDGQVFGVNVIVENVTDQRHASAEMRRLYAEAQRAIAQRDEILGIVSHDLRNPLNTILMSASLLYEQVSSDRKQTQVMIIQRAVEQTTRLIQDLLDATRADAGGLRVLPVPNYAGELVRDCVDSHMSQAQARGLTISADVESDALLLADRDRIEQLLGNLVINAITHTEPGGEIVVACEERASEACFQVRDTGCGIAPEHLPHVFDRYWQIRRSGRAGAGLGLTIAKGIVEAHGGRIWVASEPGRGTTFFFTIPLAATPAQV